MPKVCIALGGGGARGLAHLGVLEVLEKAKVPIDMIVGTSIGAVMGCGFALLPRAEPHIARAMEYLGSEEFQALGLGRLNPYESEGRGFMGTVFNSLRRGLAFSLLVRRTSIFQSNVLREVARSLIPDRSFADTVIPFGVPAMDLLSGEEVLITEGSLRDAVVASASLPGFFPPVPWKGRLLADVGVIGSVPVEAARGFGADVVIAVDISPPFQEAWSASSAATGLGVIYRMEAIGSRRLLDAQLARADVIVHAASKAYWADFSRVADLVEVGASAARTSLDAIREAIAGAGGGEMGG